MVGDFERCSMLPVRKTNKVTPREGGREAATYQPFVAAGRCIVLHLGGVFTNLHLVSMDSVKI